MAVHLAAHYAQNSTGGRGILLGSVPGVPPPTVLILGAGTVGRAAARQALASGAHVIVLDADLAKLRRLNRDYLGRAVTVMAGLERLEKYTALADVVIGAILIPGGRPDLLITEAMVKSMKQGSVIIDVSIDQGGCVETSRPTDIEDPTFKVHGTLHYCVPNMTANISRTASRALATAALPYLLQLAEKGLAGAAGRGSGSGCRGLSPQGEDGEEGGGRDSRVPGDPARVPPGKGSAVMSWYDDYKSKLVSAAEAVSMVKSGDNVYYGGNAAIPFGLVRALADRRDELTDVHLSHVLLVGKDPLSTPDMAGSFRHNSLFVGPADREAVNDGRADYVPVFLYMIPRLFLDKVIPVDVAMVMTSPPDEHGFMSLGVETLASKAACQMAKRVIVQVNEKMPRVLGDCFLHVNRVDAVVEHTEGLPQLEVKPANPVELAIGANILKLIEPGRPCRWASEASPTRCSRRSTGRSTSASTPRCSRTAGCARSSAGW